MSTRLNRPYRSRDARLGAVIAARLFATPRETQMPRDASDAQASIRTAIRRRRRALGLTQAQAGQLLGMPMQTYHRIELGTRRIHIDELGAICAAFGVHIGELVEDGQLAHAYANAASALLGQGLG